MKRKLTFAALALSGICILWACSSDNPASIAKKFLSAMAAGDYKAAKHYTSKDSQAALDIHIDDSAAHSTGKIEVINETILGNDAFVSYTANGMPRDLHLIREDQRWKVAFSGQDVEGNPQEIGAYFLKCMARGEIDQAKQYATKNSQNCLDMMRSSAAAKQAHNDHIVIGPTKIQGDQAEMAYFENGKLKNLKLIQQNHLWQVSWLPLGVLEP